MTQGFLNGVFLITVNKLSIVIHNLKNKLKKQNISTTNMAEPDYRPHSTLLLLYVVCR